MSPTEIQAITGLIIAITALVGVIFNFLRKAPAQLPSTGESTTKVLEQTTATTNSQSDKIQLLESRLDDLASGPAK